MGGRHENSGGGLVVGASGTIGRAVAAELAQRHDIIAAGRTSGDVSVDITDQASIRSAFESIGTVDAVVSASRISSWGKSIWC